MLHVMPTSHTVETSMTVLVTARIPALRLRPMSMRVRWTTSLDSKLLTVPIARYTELD